MGSDEVANGEIEQRRIHPANKKGRLLWIGDCAVATGFARVTEGILNVLRHEWDVHVLALNYNGDPHPLQRTLKMYPTVSLGGGDRFGVHRSGLLITQLKPDVVVCLNDPWNLPAYMRQTGNSNVIGYLAVDGLNCRGSELNGLMAAIFWTEFGVLEAQRGGYRGLAGVVPLGVHLESFKPMDKAEARARSRLPPKVREAFIVGNVNRNQPRKRLDLTMMYFAEWVRTKQIDDAYLYLHVAPTGDQGFDIDQFTRYLGITNKVIIAEPEIGQGVTDLEVARTYSCFDLQITTTQGEGFGLTTLEGQACGVPQIVPDWAALGEICADSALLVPCTTQMCTPNNINAIGGIADREEFIACLDRAYREPALLDDLRRRGIENAGRDCYRWPHIGRAFGDLIDQALTPTRLTRVGGDGEKQAGGGEGDATPADESEQEIP